MEDESTQKSFREIEKPIREIKRVTAGYDIEKDVEHGDTSENLKTTEEFREAFRATCQELLLDGNYIYELPNLKINTKAIKEKFKKVDLTEDRIQKKNILLDPDIWHTLVESEKTRVIKEQNISGDVLGTFLYYGELFAVNSNNALILRFSKFENPKSKINKNDPEIASRELFKFFAPVSSLKDCLKVLDVLTDISEEYKDFSIHEYFLPYGVSEEGLENAVLLYRYDTSNKTHVNYYGDINPPLKKHDLDTEQFIPTVYKKVYPDKLTGPHFHFCEGISSIYKLSDNKKYSKVGDGYGIGIKHLRNYLKKIRFGEYENIQEEELYQKNDFGMPFHNREASSLSKMVRTLEILRKNPHDFRTAYDLFDKISNLNRDKFMDKDKSNDNDRHL